MLQDGQAEAFVEAGLDGQRRRADDGRQVVVGNPAQRPDDLAQPLGVDASEEVVVEPAPPPGQEEV